MKKPTKFDTYNAKRVRLCEFSVTTEAAKTVEPALKRLAAHYGGKVPALSQAVLEADKKLTRSKKE